MTSTKRLPRIFSEQLNKDNRKQDFYKREVLNRFSVNTTLQDKLSCCDRLGTVWDQVSHLSTGRIPTKINLTLNDRLDPQIAMPFSSCTWYDKWYLYCIVSDFLS